MPKRMLLLSNVGGGVVLYGCVGVICCNCGLEGECAVVDGKM